MYSSDRGRTWSGKFTLQENIGAMNVMEPAFLRLRSGKILFAFCRKNSEADCLRTSVSPPTTPTPSRPTAPPHQPRPLLHRGSDRVI